MDNLNLLAEHHKGIIMGHLNVRSLWNKFDLINTTFSGSCFDIIGMSETWLSSHYGDTILDIDSYSLYRLDRQTLNVQNNIKKGGGVCLYVKKSLNVTNTHLERLCTSNTDIECQWIEIVNLNQRNIMICNAYRPPQGNVENFISYLESCLENIDFSIYDVFIMGDINIDFLDNQNVHTKKLKEFLTQTGLTNLIKKPTRFSSNKNSLIDHIYTNSNVILSYGVLDINVSDHEMVYVVRKKPKVSYVTSKFEGRSYRNYNRERFIDDLNQQDWGNYNTLDDPNEIWSKFYNNVIQSIDIMCPLKTYNIKKIKEIWVTNEMLELIHNKDLALRKAKRTKLSEDWKIARRLRNDCVSMVRKAKADYIQNELHENISDSKKFWKQIKNIIPNQSGGGDRIKLVNHENGNTIKEADTADFINNFFTNVGPNLSRDMNKEWRYQGTVADRHLSDIILNTEEILKFTKEINIYKSSSVPHLSTKILKEAFMSQLPRLQYLFEQILKSCTFPLIWKMATVIPLKKAGNSNLVTNLRPISLLPLPSKIFEKIIHNRLIHHLEVNQYLDINQGGFRKNNSTINTAVRFTNDIFNAINSRYLTLSTFIDMAKAFDTVNHVILLKKMELLGITGNILKLIRSYLSDRSQSTIANGITSRPQSVVCGIPQGSTVGPLMFIIYINDIASILKYCKYQMYADDTVLYLSGKEIGSATEKICTDLSSFKNWCDMNKLTINVKKTKYVIYGLKSQIKDIRAHRLYIDEQVLDRVNSYKYLGVTLDACLTYNRHIENCLNIASHKLFLLSKVRKYITFEASLRIYKTMILPIIEYGDILYDGSNHKLLSRIQTLQNRCLRICNFEPYHVPVIYLHEIAQIAKLNYRRNMHLLLFMFKQKTNMNIVNIRIVHTRAHDAVLFNTERPQSEKYKNNVLYKGAVLWNQLSVPERNFHSYENFKKHLKKLSLAKTIPNI